MSHSLQEELLALHRRSEAPTASEINLMLNYDGEDLQTLYHCANELRQAYVGSEIYAHGTVVVSNMCDKNCAHCSMRHANSKLERYCLSQAEVANLAHQGLHYGCTTIVLQSGETEAMDTEMVCTTVDRIKIMPNLAVTAAFGVRPYNDYRFFRANGCDRYYLPFKTADRATFAELFPDMNLDEHLDSLYEARHSGMQIGSGFLVGLPDRELKLTAEDIRFTTQLDLDFIDCVPFFSHPDTPLAHKTFMKDVEIYFKTIAILRLLNPYAHITTSLLYNALVDGGLEKSLSVGANVFAADLTPQRYRDPRRPSYVQHHQDADDYRGASFQLLPLLKQGRKVATSLGHSLRPAWLEKQ